MRLPLPTCTLRPRLWALLSVLTFAAFGCSDGDDDGCADSLTYTIYEPSYLTHSGLELAPLTFIEPKPVAEPGKFFLYGNFVLLNDRGEGIHFIDFSDPSEPVNVGFLQIPGNFDMVADGNWLYADSYSDLLIFNIAQLTAPAFVSRFTYVFSRFPLKEGLYGFHDPETDRLTVGWSRQEVSVPVDCDAEPERPFVPAGFDVERFKGSNAQGGTLSRLILQDNTLFLLSPDQLRSLNVSAPADPQLGLSLPLQREALSAFLHHNRLYVGSEEGTDVFIHDGPAPSLSFAHEEWKSCFPVATSGQTAFVGRRKSDCYNGAERLETADLSASFSVSTIGLFDIGKSPEAMTSIDQTLFVCSVADGLSVHDVSDPAAPERVADYPDIVAQAICARPNQRILIAVSSLGISQYDATAPANLTQTGFFPF